MKGKSSFFESRAYLALYDLIRKTPLLNFLAHKFMQGESLHKLPLYMTLYRTMIQWKAERYFYQPPMLEITVTDKCNSRCIMCLPVVHGGQTIMSQSLFEDVCRQARHLGIGKLSLTGGEPLLDEKIFDKILFAKNLGFTWVHMFTNASLMNSAKAERLLASGLDSLTVSIDSAVGEEYEKIRRGLNFDQVMGNLRGLMDLKRRKGAHQLLVRVNLVCLPENRFSRRIFRRSFADLADQVEIIDAHNFAGRELESNVRNSQEYSQITRYPCHLLFGKLVISPEGMVRKCSIDYGPAALMGDARRQSLQEILKASRLPEIKKKHLSYDFSEPGCDRCNHKESWWVDY